jgi:hypothetical protein
MPVRGDKRHMPYVAGKGGMGPPNLPDAPPWVDVYDRTKDPDQVPHSFVRSDEIPGVKVMSPNGIGPAPFYDERQRDPVYRAVAGLGCVDSAVRFSWRQTLRAGCYA